MKHTPTPWTKTGDEVSKLRLSEITLTTKDGQYVRLTLGEAFASGRPLRKSSRGTTCRVCSL